ncbi:hypothetical protein [Anthocerotibacter panamensis]|uniref:hypothetical protein n=1 Tax=Anthocerotibacter panamensis TaxID=2857077 RepID=UPI001C4082DC|nr:hypothetical protein [Anthocerotibacter panamensis]
MNEFKPPEGLNFHCAEDLSILALASGLGSVASFLLELDPRARLYTYTDWWEHDGLHFPKGKTDLHGLFEMIKTPQALLRSMPGYNKVFVGVAPASNLWYLRFYVDWDDHGAHLMGRFDLTLPLDCVRLFKSRVLPLIEGSLIQQEASAYYATILRS